MELHEHALLVVLEKILFLTAASVTQLFISDVSYKHFLCPVTFPPYTDKVSQVNAGLARNHSSLSSLASHNTNTFKAIA